MATAEGDEMEDNLDFSKKKKKKKTKVDAVDDLDDEPLEDEEEGDFDEEFDFSKKKKKKKTRAMDIQLNDQFQNELDSVDGGNEVVDGKSWLGSSRDYTYEELLERVYDILREKDPEMASGEKKKLIIRPPQVVRVGAKKTSFANYQDMCKTMKRDAKHFVNYLLSELGTSGSVDMNNQLIIRGRFQSKHVEQVLRRYIREYVMCHTCKSPETVLEKDTRLFFLRCETCGSRYSVQSITSGFKAVTGKRAALRAKIV